jgi:hypothetical protein
VLVSPTPIVMKDSPGYFLYPKFCTMHDGKLLLCYISTKEGPLSAGSMLLDPSCLISIVIYDINYKMPVILYNDEFGHPGFSVYCEHPTKNEYYFWKDKFLVGKHLITYLVGYCLDLEKGTLGYVQSRWPFKPVKLPSYVNEFKIAGKSDRFLIGYQSMYWQHENYFVFIDGEQQSGKAFKLQDHSRQAHYFSLCHCTVDGINSKVYYTQFDLPEVAARSGIPAGHANCLYMDGTIETICSVYTKSDKNKLILQCPKIINERFLVFEAIEAKLTVTKHSQRYVFVIDLLKNKYVIVKSWECLRYFIKEANEDKIIIYLCYVWEDEKKRPYFELIKTINISGDNVIVYTSRHDFENTITDKTSWLPLYENLTLITNRFIILFPARDDYFGSSSTISAIFIPIDELEIPYIPDTIIVDYLPANRSITIPDNF